MKQSLSKQFKSCMLSHLRTPKELLCEVDMRVGLTVLESWVAGQQIATKCSVSW